MARPVRKHRSRHALWNTCPHRVAHDSPDVIASRQMTHDPSSLPLFASDPDGGMKCTACSVSLSADSWATIRSHRCCCAFSVGGRCLDDGGVLIPSGGVKGVRTGAWTAGVRDGLVRDDVRRGNSALPTT